MAINLCKIINGNQEDFYLFERKAYLEQIETKTKIYSSIAPMVSVIIPVYNTDNYAFCKPIFLACAKFGILLFKIFIRLSLFA